MMQMTLTLMAALIATMFVTTAAFSIINSIKESRGLKEASARRMAF
ncbi:MAG: hypothetical protein KL863_15075 [Rhizobium sp.]|nr:hypothetical protein [Rhizobium sp.]